MRPALSIVFFTVSSGAGLGLIALLVLAGWFELGGGLSVFQVHRGGIVGLVLVALGLVSSVLHLANPKNAWRAFSRFATSWLSREAVFAAAFFPVCVAWMWGLYSGAAWRNAAGLATLLLAWAVLVCTAMIYASLKPIRQWHTRLTPLVYFLLGHASGALLLLWVAGRGRTDAAPYVWLAAVLLALGAFAKLAWYARSASPSAADEGRSIQSALGVTAAQVKLLDAGHTHGTFLTSEFVFRLARNHARRLRAVVWLCGFAAPMALAVLMPGAALLAAGVCLAGLMAERWLFFAEARHTVTLYHGAARA